MNRNQKYILLLLGMTATIILFSLFLIVTFNKLTAPKSPASVLPQSHSADVGPGPGKYWHHDAVLLPNPDLSPGEVRTTDLTAICEESTLDFRHTSAGMKRRVYERYNEVPHSGDCVDTIRTTKAGREVTEACEIDHIISLELGGADTEANLFPQPYNPPSGFGAHAKDQVENYLHDQVCKHNMLLTDAQKKIATDWYQVYLDAHLKPI